ncbi:MAG TPA: hypothetical protein VHE55_15615 [Fimbriimonadaceae bacterium]|nr:hypothetical protein [Fimbriimonadaceae bacterium]
MTARKGLWIAAFVAFAGCAYAGDKDSLFLSSDAFMAPKSQVSRVPQLEVDDQSDPATVQYSLARQSDWDPHYFSLTPGNCAALLGLIAVCGGLVYFRDRLFSSYR